MIRNVTTGEVFVATKNQRKLADFQLYLGDTYIVFGFDFGLSPFASRLYLDSTPVNIKGSSG